MWGSNSRPWDYETHALPTEPTQQLNEENKFNEKQKSKSTINLFFWEAEILLKISLDCQEGEYFFLV